MDARVPPPLPLLLLLFHSIPISSVENVENCLTYCCCWRRLLICERGHDLPTHTVNRHLLALAAIPIDENRSFEIRYCIFLHHGGAGRACALAHSGFSQEPN